MLNISVNLETGLAKPSQAATIKAGGSVPVTILFSSNPGSNTVIELALSPQSSSPEVVAYHDEFVAQNQTTWTGTLDANDTRLIELLTGKQSQNLSCEVVVTSDSIERRPFPNFAIAVQSPTIVGPETSEGGPVYLVQSTADARYLRASQALAEIDAAGPASRAAARVNIGAASQEDFETFEDLKGAAEGLAELDSGGKVPVAQLPDSVIGQIEYQGGWNATTNSPAIPAAAAGNKGHYYVATVAGSSDPDTAGRTFEPGDWIVSNGTTWDKVDNTEPVATEVLAGISRRATEAEAVAGTEAAAHITPAALAAVDRAYLSRINLLLCGY